MEAAGYEMFQRVYGGCISTDDLAIRRRPYHHNCSCALHKSGGGHCSHVAKVSYPIRRSWSESSIVAMKSVAASPGSSPCCSSSPTVAAPVNIKDSPAASLPTHVPNDHE
ncbi:hypothetical protein L2E82_39097 [Cichorium intybus]|uniref:Uncharacterized protein n=1 Tax=Cichorium intybus TaxID=13427 RepID=A0ACB9AGQ8_CICIN|nr:hypothetical protein L2E82_39097 [Cichorium intybus]